MILVADAGDFVFYDCVYEELLQALGPINDDASVPWTMFNDDVQMGFFGLYDQYLLNILYHPRIRPGMTRAEVEAVLPEVLPAVRAWIARNEQAAAIAVLRSDGNWLLLRSSPRLAYAQALSARLDAQSAEASARRKWGPRTAAF